jgi:nicotinamide-nucleotide amidase
MFEKSVLSALEPPGRDAHVRLRTFGLTETELEDRLRKAIPDESLKDVSIISSPTGVDAYIPPGGDQLVHVSAVERELRSYIFTEGDARLETVVVGLLISRRKTVAVAESVTGGLIASSLVSVPGASDAFREGFVTYGNEAKIERLGVSARTLEAHGAVSAETCVEMALGARDRSAATFSLSTTGIAGPSGGVPGKPVGTCFAALAAPEGIFCRRFQFPGDREMVRVRTAYFALDMLRLALIGEYERLEEFRAADDRRHGDAAGRNR